MLPAPVARFCEAAAALHRRVIPTSWGFVVTDDRYPEVWDANNATVLHADGRPTLEAILRKLRPALREAGARTEHVEFWETEVPYPALEDATAIGLQERGDAVMVHRETAALDAAAVGAGVAIEEVAEPTPALWTWIAASLSEFGAPLPETVERQLVARMREVFAPAWSRWFVAFVEGEPAGYANLIRAGGVGYLEDVVTMPVYRRRGIASATVRRAVEASAAAGDDCTFLLAEDGGGPQTLYERLGFETVTRVASLTRPLPAADTEYA